MDVANASPVLGGGRFEVRGTLGSRGAGVVYRLVSPRAMSGSGSVRRLCSEMHVQAARRGVMRRHVTLVVALAVMLGAGGGAGCVPPIRVSSTITHENPPPIERLLMIADIKSPLLGDAMYDGFHGGIMAALSTCHVEGRLVHKDPVELDEEGRLLGVLKEHQPDAQLLITSRGGTFTRYWGRPEASKRLFEVELFVGKHNTLAWRAEVVMQDSHGDPGANGADLAVHIISRLRADGLLKSCPSGELSSAVCRTYRRAAPICR